MTENLRTDVETESEFDPATIAERPGIEYIERTIRHDDTDHCEADVAGRVIVGVTDEDGRTLLLVDREQPGVFLPHATVDAGEDWTQAAARAVEELTGIATTIDGPVRVRRVEHMTDSTDERHNVSYHVVFGGRPRDATIEPPNTEENRVEAGWFAEYPVDRSVGTEQEDSLDDVAAFLE